MTVPAASAHEPSYSKYTAGCRCAGCREANRLYHAGARARRRGNALLADRAGHGNASTYANYACRCNDCRAAHAKRMRNEPTSRRGEQ